MRYLLILILLFHSFCQNVFAQATSDNVGTDYEKLYKTVTDEYGFDQVLVNGLNYKERYARKIGHQFIMENQFYRGDLTFKGIEYKGIEMKYDIYDRQVLINVKSNNTQVCFIPPNDFISAFRISNMLFAKFEFQGEPGFFQVVFDSQNLKCLYSWYKVRLDSGSKPGYSEFTRSEKRKYLVMNGSFMTFRNKRSFIERFPGEVRPQLNKYIKINHIKINKSSDTDMSQLLAYCVSLL
jgi:hypothetical protein